MKKFLTLLLSVLLMVGIAAPISADAYVASVDGTEYTTVKEAVANADGKIVVLLQNYEGPGFDIENGKTVTLDLNNHEYTIKPGHGSAGTETNGIRVLQGGNLTIKNGTIIPTEDSYKNSADEDKWIKVVIANYGTLLLDGVELKTNGKIQYTINNRGELTLKGETKVPTGDSTEIAKPVAITNDPYTSTTTAVLNIDDENVEVGDVLVERYNGGKVQILARPSTIASLSTDGNDVTTIDITTILPEEEKVNTKVEFVGLGNEFMVGDVVEFSIKTVVPTAYEGMLIVKGHGILSGDDCVKLEYFDGTTYQPLVGSEFGPATGFPLMNTESKFRATFVDAGASSYNIQIVYAFDSNDKVVVAETTKDIKVYAPEVAFEGLKDSYYVGDVAEFSIKTVVPTPYNNPLYVKGLGILSGDDCVELEYLEGTEWKPLVGSEFGPATGFPLMNTESKFRAKFVKAGSASYVINIVDVLNDGVVATTNKSIKVHKLPTCAGSNDKNCDGVVTCDEIKGAGWTWNNTKGVCEFTGKPTVYVVDTATR